MKQHSIKQTNQTSKPTFRFSNEKILEMLRRPIKNPNKGQPYRELDGSPFFDNCIARKIVVPMNEIPKESEVK